MDFIQLTGKPSDGIVLTDSYCFGKLTTRQAIYGGGAVHQFRDHPGSNKNNGGWRVLDSNRTNFRLILTF